MKDLERIAQFYNEYQVINFRDQNELKSKREVFTKQMEELVNDVLSALVKIGKEESKKMPAGTEMPVGILLSTLITNNLVTEKKFIEVQKNLKEVKKLAKGLGFDKRVVEILNALVP